MATSAPTSFIERRRAEILRGSASGAFSSDPPIPIVPPLPTTQGIRFEDLNGDQRDDLIWIDRQAGMGDGRRVHVRLANKEKAGTLLPERLFRNPSTNAYLALSTSRRRGETLSLIHI